MHFENLWCMYVCLNKLGILSPHEGGLCMSINPGKVCLRRIDPPAFSLSLPWQLYSGRMISNC